MVLILDQVFTIDSPSPFPLDFGFRIWDLDLGPGFGTGLGLDNIPFIQLFGDSSNSKSKLSALSDDSLSEGFPKRSFGLDDYFLRIRDESQPRLRICFDPEQEIPLLQKWFHVNNHPSRLQVSSVTCSVTM